MDKSSIAAMRVSHLGKILSNIAILGVVVCLASVVYFLLIAIYYIILAMILLCTLFIILVYYPDFMDLFTNTETINDFVANFTVNYLPIIAPVTLAVSVLAIITLAISKQGNIGRIVVSVICLLAAAVSTIIFTFMGVS